MKQEQTDYREEQGNLPYKTYDEILSEKNRQERFHHGMVIVSGIFLMLCAVIVGISMIWSNSSNPLELFRQNGDAGGLKLNFLGANADNPVLGNDGNAFLPPFAEMGDAENLLYAFDFGRAIIRARASVVGIEAETFDGDSVSGSSGSGTVLSKNGYIITGSHVIRDSDSIIVTLENGERHAAFVIGNDNCCDIAVLKIDAENLVAAELGDSDVVAVGEPAIAAGGWFENAKQTSTFGTISGVAKYASHELFQTDAAIHAANTGGPLLNEKGQVIGINTAEIPLDGCDGLGFAIPINTALSIAENLIQNGSSLVHP